MQLLYPRSHKICASKDSCDIVNDRPNYMSAPCSGSGEHTSMKIN